MKKPWILPVVGLLTIVFALGAVACSDDEETAGSDDATATTEVMSDTPEPTGDASGTPAGGDQPGAVTTVVVTENATLGNILTTFDGYTVYTFDNDTGGTSACTGDCASIWPPLPSAGEPTGSDAVTGTLGTITRDGGATQVTYEGKPLYMYSSDPSPGDTNGDGVGGVWHVIVLD